VIYYPTKSQTLGRVLYLTRQSQIVDTPFRELYHPMAVIVQLYHGRQFYWWKKPLYPEKTTDLWKVNDKLDGIPSTPRIERIGIMSYTLHVKLQYYTMLNMY
jgi:hypothetical protein